MRMKYLESEYAKGWAMKWPTVLVLAIVIALSLLAAVPFSG